MTEAAYETPNLTGKFFVFRCSPETAVRRGPIDMQLGHNSCIDTMRGVDAGEADAIRAEHGLKATVDLFERTACLAGKVDAQYRFGGKAPVSGKSRQELA